LKGVVDGKGAQRGSPDCPTKNLCLQKGKDHNQGPAFGKRRGSENGKVSSTRREFSERFGSAPDKKEKTARNLIK